MKIAGSILFVKTNFIHFQMDSNLNESKLTTELTVKLATDDWIVGKKIDQRQLYMAFKSKGNSNLMDINAEVDKIMASEFRNICLPP